MDRRQVLASGVSAAAIALAPRALAQTPGDAQLNAAFDQVFADYLRNDPELATSLGLDAGANANLRSRLGDNSYAALAKDLALSKAARAKVAAVDPAGLSPQAKIDREVVLYDIESNIVGPERFGLGSPQRPYPISQQNGIYFGLPDFLDSTHPVKTTADAEAYLARLALMDRQLDNRTDVQRREAEKERIAPDFSLDLALGQMAKLRAPAPAENQLVRSLVRRATAANIPGDWQARAAKIVEAQVYPALDRQIALVRGLRGKARPAAGVWAIPGGADIYAAALAQATTTTLTPDAVHRMGLEQVADLTAQLDTILKGQGLTQGSVGVRLGALNQLPAQLYPNTDAGRADLIAGLNAGVAGMQAKLPQAFTNPPNAPLEIRRVAPEIQDGAPNGYYFRAPPRRLAPGDLLDQPEEHRRLAEVHLAQPHLSRGRPRPSPPDLHRAARADASPCARLPSSTPISKAGRSTPSSWRTSSAAMRRRSSARATSSPSSSAPRGWWSTPASTPSAGRTTRRRNISSTPSASRGPARSARSSAIACRPARRAPTRSVTPRGCAPATMPSASPARSSTSSTSTTCSNPARCRSRCSSASSPSGRGRFEPAPARNGRASFTNRPRG